MNLKGRNKCPKCGAPSLASEVCERCSLAPAPCSVVSTSHEVIEHRLLVALNDQDKVAIVGSKEDVDMLIDALDSTMDNRGMGARVKMRKFADGLRQLRREAFPPNTQPSRDS